MRRIAAAPLLHFFRAEKVSFYWGGMPTQAPMLLLRGPQSTNSTSQVKDLASQLKKRLFDAPYPRRSKLKSICCRASWQMELFSKAKEFRFAVTLHCHSFFAKIYRFLRCLVVRYCDPVPMNSRKNSCEFLRKRSDNEAT